MKNINDLIEWGNEKEENEFSFSYASLFNFSKQYFCKLATSDKGGLYVSGMGFGETPEIAIQNALKMLNEDKITKDNQK